MEKQTSYIQSKSYVLYKDESIDIVLISLIIHWIRVIFFLATAELNSVVGWIFPSLTFFEDFINVPKTGHKSMRLIVRSD